MWNPRRIVGWAATALTLGVAGCMPVVSELKEARNPHAVALHEQLSESIHSFGFSHGVRSLRDGDRQIDSIYVAVPLDSLKRRYIGLHHMLFNVARLCARPEYSKISIQIELNAGDEGDRAYMRGIVEPIVADARNVTVLLPRDGTNDVVITMSNAPALAATRPAAER